MVQKKINDKKKVSKMIFEKNIAQEFLSQLKMFYYFHWLLILVKEIFSKCAFSAS